MSEAKHTPGPWFVDFEPIRVPENIEGDLRIYSTDWEIAYVRADAGDQAEGDADQRETMANARLIAAAPEMYEVCNEVCRVFFEEPEATLLQAIEAVYDRCRAIIDRAEGRA